MDRNASAAEDEASLHGMLAGAPPPPTIDGSGAVSLPMVSAPSTDEARLRRIVAEHYDFLWRSLRRLGVAQSVAEDAVQMVFCVAARKMGPIPVYAERRFLFAIAMRVASDERRARRRHPDAAGPEEAPDWPDDQPAPDELADLPKARAVLDRLIAQLPLEVGAVFVLSEIEEMTAPQIADLLGLPLGTVASRLRRGRELFDAAVHRYHARCRGTP